MIFEKYSLVYENYDLLTIDNLNNFLKLLKYNKHTEKYSFLFNEISKKLKESKYKFIFVTKEKNRRFHRLFRLGKKKQTKKFFLFENINKHISNHFNFIFEKDIIDIVKKNQNKNKNKNKNKDNIKEDSNDNNNEKKSS